MKIYDSRGNEINDPYNVIKSEIKGKAQELAKHIISLEDPEKLLEAYAIGRDFLTLMNTFFDIYGPSLENLVLPAGLDQIEKNNEKYRKKLVEKLSQNQGISDKDMLVILERNKNESSKMLALAFDKFCGRK